MPDGWVTVNGKGLASTAWQVGTRVHTKATSSASARQSRGLMITAMANDDMNTSAVIVSGCEQNSALESNQAWELFQVFLQRLFLFSSENAEPDTKGVNEVQQE